MQFYICHHFCFFPHFIICFFLFAVNEELNDASRKGDVSKMKRSIEWGAQVNCRIDDWSPLHFAAAKGHSSAVELLLDKGAMVDATNREGKTALHESAYYGHDKVASMLLDRGAAIDKARKDRTTPLMVAASRGKTSTVGLLLQRGADKEKRDKEGKTALEIAQKSHYSNAEIRHILR